MPQPPLPYAYTAQGAGFVAEVKSLGLREKEDRLLNLLRNQPQASTTILDGFHHLVCHLTELRSQGDEDTNSHLPGEFIATIVRLMKGENQLFGFSSGNDFFQWLDEWSPPVFQNQAHLPAAVMEHFPVHREPVAAPNSFSYDFPSTYDAATSAKLREVCINCDAAMGRILEKLPVMQRANRIRERFLAGDPNLTQADLANAKQTFIDHRPDYQRDAKLIADWMPFVHGCSANYADSLEVHQVYNQYLAKLLASREAKQPVEKYVLNLAQPAFNFTLPEFKIDEKEELRGITPESKAKDYRKKLQIETNRLESRYKKRKLMALLEEGTPSYKILNDLVKLAEKDPDDIKTHILLARMIAEHAQSITNGAKRVHYREEALNYCKHAFSHIDTYLDLQGMDNLQDRDRMRVGFVKTISAIRNPLVRGNA